MTIAYFCYYKRMRWYRLQQENNVNKIAHLFTLPDSDLDYCTRQKFLIGSDSEICP